MMFLSIVAVLVFAVILCFVEIPMMLKTKLYKEIWVFCILIFLGVTLAILKSLNVKIPNPADWVTAFYSPISGLMKSILK